MSTYTWLSPWITILIYAQKSLHWNYITTSCTPRVGYSGQNISLLPISNSLSEDDNFEWHVDTPRVTNRLCLYQHKRHIESDTKYISNIMWQCLENHTLILINLTTSYNRRYYFESFKSRGWGIPKINSICYNVSVHSVHQTHCCTTTSMNSHIPVRSSYTTLSLSTSTNFTHTAVHYAAGNVETQHNTATPYTMWIIPLIVTITIIVLICFKFPQRAWNKCTQYRYSGMLAAA